MTGAAYLQRLFDRAGAGAELADLAPAAPSESPVALADQRLQDPRLAAMFGLGILGPAEPDTGTEETVGAGPAPAAPAAHDRGRAPPSAPAPEVRAAIAPAASPFAPAAHAAPPTSPMSPPGERCRPEAPSPSSAIGRVDERDFTPTAVPSEGDRPEPAPGSVAATVPEQTSVERPAEPPLTPARDRARPDPAFAELDAALPRGTVLPVAAERGAQAGTPAPEAKVQTADAGLARPPEPVRSAALPAPAAPPPIERPEPAAPAGMAEQAGPRSEPGRPAPPNEAKPLPQPSSPSRPLTAAEASLIGPLVPSPRVYTLLGSRWR